MQVIKKMLHCEINSQFCITIDPKAVFLIYDGVSVSELKWEANKNKNSRTFQSTMHSYIHACVCMWFCEIKHFLCFIAVSQFNFYFKKMCWNILLVIQTRVPNQMVLERTASTAFLNSSKCVNNFPTEVSTSNDVYLWLK